MHTAGRWTLRSTWRPTSPGSGTPTARFAHRSSPCSGTCFRSVVSRILVDSTDVRTLLARLPAHADLFSATEPIVIARAPGRLDLMGGIADYSGSLVLQLPLAVAAVAAAQWSRDEDVRVRPLSVGTSEWVHQASVPVSDLLDDYASVRARLTADPRKRWLAYVAGAVTVLHRERGVAFPRGLRLLLSSDVPVGKGVSSSAAIEVATMHAICALLDLTLDGRELAL